MKKGSKSFNLEPFGLFNGVKPLERCIETRMDTGAGAFNFQFVPPSVPPWQKYCEKSRFHELSRRLKLYTEFAAHQSPPIFKQAMAIGLNLTLLKRHCASASPHESTPL